MGRQIRRVPLDFDHPLNEVWPGFLMPDSLGEEKCDRCDDTGYSDFARHMHARWYGHVPFDPAETGSTPYTSETPAVRAFAKRNVEGSPAFYQDWMGLTGSSAITREAQRLADLFNGQWSHHLHQDDVDALIAADRLWDFTRRWTKSTGWERIEPAPVVTAEQVNTWSISGFGHDSANCWIVVRAACERAGERETCAECDGHGSHEKYPGQRAEAEAWTATEPPTGDGWQLWETVSEGSPISPVFATAEGLAGWMSDPARGDHLVPTETAAKFIADGWAPSFMASPQTGLVSGVEFVGFHKDGA